MHLLAYFSDQLPNDTDGADFCARMCKGKETCPTSSGCQKRCQDNLEIHLEAFVKQLDKLESSLCQSTAAIKNNTSGQYKYKIFLDRV